MFVLIVCAELKKIIRNIIFGNGGTFYPGWPFSDNLDKGTPYLCFDTKKPNYECGSTRFYFTPFMENSL